MTARTKMCLTMALGLLTASALAQAQTIITTDTTIDYAINDYVLIQQDNAPRPPIVNLVDGGFIGVNLLLKQNSILNMSGGEVNQSEYGGLIATEGSVAYVSGGKTGGLLAGIEGGRIYFSGGDTYYINAHDDGYLRMTGGHSFVVTALENARVDIFGGTVDYWVEALLNGIVTLTGYNLKIENDRLTGQLLLGGTVDAQVNRQQNGQILLVNVPEPGMAPLFIGSMMGAGLLFHRRARKPRT